MFRLDAGTFHFAAEQLPDGARTRFGVQLLLGHLAEHIYQSANGMEYDKALLDDLRALVPLIDDAWFADLSPAKQRSGEFTGLGERWHTADEIRDDILTRGFQDSLGGQAIVHLACLSRELPHLFCAYVAAVHDKLLLPPHIVLSRTHAPVQEPAPHFDDWIYPECFCDYDGHDSSYNDADARLPIGGVTASEPKLRWNPPAVQPHDEYSASCVRLQRAVHEALWITVHDYNDQLAHNTAVAAGAVPDFDGSPLGTLVDLLYRRAPEELQKRVDAERDGQPRLQVGPWETLRAARMAVRSVPRPLGLWIPDAPAMQRRLVFKDAVQLATVGTCAPTHSPGAMLCPGHVQSDPTRLVNAFSAVQQAIGAAARQREAHTGDGHPPTRPLDVMARQDAADLAAVFPNLPSKVAVDVVVALTRLTNFWPGELKTMSMQFGALNATASELAPARAPLFVPVRPNAQEEEPLGPSAPIAARSKMFAPVPLAFVAAGSPDARLLARMAGRPSPPRAGYTDGFSPPTQLGDAPLCAAMRTTALVTLPWHHPVRRRATPDAAWPDVGHTLVKLGVMHACAAAAAMVATARERRLVPAAGEQPGLCGLPAVFRLVALTPEGAAALGARPDRWAKALQWCRNSPVFHLGSKQGWFRTPFGPLVRNDVDRHVRRWLSLVVHVGILLVSGRGVDAWRDRSLFGLSGSRRAVVGGPEGLLCCASATDASDPATNAFVVSPPTAELVSRDPAERTRALRNLETLASIAAIALYSHTVRLLGTPDPAAEASKRGLGFLDTAPTFSLGMRRIGRQFARMHRKVDGSPIGLQSSRFDQIVADVVAASVGDPANETPPCERARRVRRSLWTLLPTPTSFAYTYGYAGAWGDGPAALHGAPGLPADDRPVYLQDPVSPEDACAHTLGFALLRNMILAGMPSRLFFEQTLKDMDLGAVRGDEDNPDGGEWIFALIQFTACVAGCTLDGYPEYATQQGLRARPADEYKALMRGGYNPDVVAQRKAEELTRPVARDLHPDSAADEHPHRLTSEDAAWTIETLVSELPTAACVGTPYLVAESSLEQVYYRVERSHWWMLGPTAKMPPRRHWFPGAEPHDPDELWPPFDDEELEPNERTLYWLHTCCPSAVWPLYKRGATGWVIEWFERCLAATRETRPDQVALAAQLMLPRPEGLMLDPPEAAPFLMRIQQELFAPGGDGYRALLSSSTAAATLVAPGTGSAPGAPAEPDDGGAPAAKRHCADRPSANTAPR